MNILDAETFDKHKEDEVSMPFASNLFFEFYQDSNEEITVALKFNDMELPMKGCDLRCPIS